jgi:hypothetical protein
VVDARDEHERPNDQHRHATVVELQHVKGGHDVGLTPYRPCARLPYATHAHLFAELAGLYKYPQH